MDSDKKLNFNPVQKTDDALRKKYHQERADRATESADTAKPQMEDPART